MTERASSKIHDKILDFSKESESYIMEQLKTLCEKNATMALQTTNPDFINGVRAARLKRFQAALMRFRQSNSPRWHMAQLSTIQGFDSKGLQLAQTITDEWAIIDGKNIESGATALFDEMHPNGKRSQNTEDEIHDILKAYYDVRPFLHFSFLFLPFPSTTPYLPYSLLNIPRSRSKISSTT
jgi:hypothetical protein